MKMSVGPKKFSIDADQVSAALAEIGRQQLGFEGFRIFSGSRNMRAEVICEARSKVIELGRFLVGEASVDVCHVLGKKVSRGEIFVITDGGRNHHLSAFGNFGQVIRKNYPVEIGSLLGAAQREPASVLGPVCAPLNLLGDRTDLSAAELGDLAVVFQSGAYGLTAGPQQVLSHIAAVEVLV
jgi:diaminopimelate decarboxylase